jgi:hypothetical protein
MVAAIQSAGQVLSSISSKVKGVADKHIFDKAFVKNILSDSQEQLSDLLTAIASDLKQEMREQGILDVVQELQADINVLGKLLDLANTSQMKPAIAGQLIPNALIPLQKSLEKAQIRFKHYGKDDVNLYCHIIGTSTVIAGYAYLGQNMPTLQNELENSIYKFQKRLLNEIAQITIQNNQEISWERIPYLLTTDGISELYVLYNSTLQINPRMQTKTAKEPSTSTKEPPTRNSKIKPDEIIVLPVSSALSRFIKIVNQENLNKSAEEYLQRGIKFMENSEFDDAILEFVKVIRKSSPQEQVYKTAEHQLKAMGFSEADINPVR